MRFLPSFWPGWLDKNLTTHYQLQKFAYRKRERESGRMRTKSIFKASDREGTFDFWCFFCFPNIMRRREGERNQNSISISFLFQWAKPAFLFFFLKLECQIAVYLKQGDSECIYTVYTLMLIPLEADLPTANFLKPNTTNFVIYLFIATAQQEKAQLPDNVWKVCWDCSLGPNSLHPLFQLLYSG